MSDHPSHSVPIDAEYEPADPAETPSTSETPKKSGGPGWISLTFVGLLALGALGLSVWSSGLLDTTDLPGPNDTALEDLRDQQADLQTRIANVSAQVEGLIDRIDSEITRIDGQIASLPSAAPAESTDLPEGLDARLAGLEAQIVTLTESQTSGIDPARIDAIERALERANQGGGASNAQLVSLRTELETLRSELATLEATQRDLATELNDVRTDSAAAQRASTSAVSASLALSAIQAAANRGETFEAEYRQLREARPDDPDIQALSSLAQIEVPTLAALKAEFRRLQNAAAARDTEDASGMGWVSTVFGDSVSVRRTSSDSDTADRLADAEAALARDDLAIAIDAVENLPGTTKPIYQTWLADARRRARLEQSLEELRLKLIAAGQ
ncbi:COG4223 family protein [Henriciella mobilis]|uniref:Uncharacterized protein n=1 Tax=Henriciella mobilis TaxID=2305467 RepID=A0A399RG54_9PROT|nr:hypothetical protein [Henriciella mobilis]RIJ30556.1 hypothetical protein D1223_08005 [Henriciella mobilis]